MTAILARRITRRWATLRPRTLAVGSILLALVAMLLVAWDVNRAEAAQALPDEPAPAEEPAQPAPSTPTPSATPVPPTAPGVPPPPPGPGPVTGQVEWEQCPFPPPPGVMLECGALNVPADRDDAGLDGGVVRLRFGIVRAPDASGEPPLVYLSGGPGQSALEFIPLAFGQLYGPLAQGRDLIILDQRGIGYSEPSLFCDEYLAWAAESLDSDLPPEQQAVQAALAIEDCRQRLIAEGVDFSDFDSEASAADLRDLRHALGYPQWNLYGASYGTRLALSAMRADPAGIRSVVLDAAYPVEANLYTEAPRNLDRAMGALFDACEDDDGCRREFPGLREVVPRLVAELNANPASVPFIDPATGQQYENLFTGDALVGFLFQSLYVTDLVQFLPEIIQAADNGEFGTIGLLQGGYVSELGLVSLGQQLAVQCNEEVAFAEPADLVNASREYPLLEGFYRSAPTLGPQILALCASWGGADAPEPIENEPVVSDIPTLIMTGSIDPITPPRWGEAIAENLANATFYEFPYTGHGVVPSRDCGAAMAQQFLGDPTAEVDASCIEEIPAPAFTTDEVEIEMVPFTNPTGFEGLRPESWDEPLPGIFQESPLVALIQQVIPGATEQEFLAQVGMQLGLSAPPEPDDTLRGDHARWNLYELSNFGQTVDLALSEHDGNLLVVQLGTPPLRRDVYYEQAFIPAVEAFDPANVPPPPDSLPSATPPPGPPPSSP